MTENIMKALEKPMIYTKSKSEFWNDEHISKQMLKAHLDPEFDGASRKLSFIRKSAEWMKEIVPPSSGPRLLDIGCGPGIYAEKFTRMGYHVTGIDFSKNSIVYARQSAFSKKLDISYIYQNYLEMELKKTFDFATMIYCDYGVLSPEERQVILGKIHLHLKLGGKLLIDVFSMKKFCSFREHQIWEACPDGGFWSEDEYLAMSGFYKYPDNVTLELVSIISRNGITPYYLWNTYFSREALIGEAQASGFKVRGIYGDVAGSIWQSESDTIAILLEK